MQLQVDFRRDPQHNALRLGYRWHGHWKTTTFVGALRRSGMTTPMVLDSAIMHEAACIAYVEQILVPTLKPGEGVVVAS